MYFIRYLKQNFLYYMLLLSLTVILMLPSIVIANWEHFTMLITVTLKVGPL